MTDRRVLERVSGPDFARLLRETVSASCPVHERERFQAHFAGPVQMWVTDQGGAAAPP